MTKMLSSTVSAVLLSLLVWTVIASNNAKRSQSTAGGEKNKRRPTKLPGQPPTGGPSRTSTARTPSTVLSLPNVSSPAKSPSKEVFELMTRVKQAVVDYIIREKIIIKLNNKPFVEMIKQMLSKKHKINVEIEMIEALLISLKRQHGDRFQFHRDRPIDWLAFNKQLTDYGGDLRQIVGAVNRVIESNTPEKYWDLERITPLELSEHFLLNLYNYSCRRRPWCPEDEEIELATVKMVAKITRGMQAFHLVYSNRSPDQTVCANAESQKFFLDSSPLADTLCDWLKRQQPPPELIDGGPAAESSAGNDRTAASDDLDEVAERIKSATIDDGSAEERQVKLSAEWFRTPSGRDRKVPLWRVADNAYTISMIQLGGVIGGSVLLELLQKRGDDRRRIAEIQRLSHSIASNIYSVASKFFVQLAQSSPSTEPALAFSCSHYDDEAELRAFIKFIGKISTCINRACAGKGFECLAEAGANALMTVDKMLSNFWIDNEAPILVLLRQLAADCRAHKMDAGHKRLVAKYKTFGPDVLAPRDFNVGKMEYHASLLYDLVRDVLRDALDAGNGIESPARLDVGAAIAERNAKIQTLAPNT